MNGADFKLEEPHTLDLASCIGASWVFGGHANTLEALVNMVKPGGWVIAGEPYWLQEPSQDYLGASGFTKRVFGSHFSNAEAGERLGLHLLHTIVSSNDDWAHTKACNGIRRPNRPAPVRMTRTWRNWSSR